MTRAEAAVAGAVAAVSGAGVGHLVAAWVSPEASPVIAVGSAVIDAAPTPVKEWAVATFGTADKPLLVAGVVIGALLAAGVCGVIARRSLAVGAAGLVGLASVATAAVVVRRGVTMVTLLPGLVTAVIGVFALAVLRRRIDEAAAGAATSGAGGVGPFGSGPPGSSSRSAGDDQVRGHDRDQHQGQRQSQLLGRRRFLAVSAGFAVVGAGAALVGQRLVDSARQLVRPLPKPRMPLAPLPTGLEASVPGVTTLVTPREEFYRIDTALIVPRVDVDGWRLQVDGSVALPFSLSYDELLAMPLIERDITLTCVSNEVGGGYASSARWLGVRVADLLRRAQVGPGADQILSRSVDGFTCSTPTAALVDDRDALIAVAMNGEPLDATHGFPARLVTPGLYGYVGATKWLTRLTATTFAADQAYWTRRGWARKAPVKTMTRIDTPRGGGVSAGQVAIAGVAWAQRRGIRRVEVQVDDGPWQEARLGPTVGVDYWRQWWLSWQATPGEHTLRARAVDGTGAAQPTVTSPPFPDGASGLHQVGVRVG